MLTAIKEETDSNTVIVGDFNTSLTPMDSSSRQKINKETQVLKDTIDQIDLIDIYSTFHLKTPDYTFFSSAHGTFSRTNHILGHKSSLSKFKKTEIISSIFSDHNAMRLQINYREKNVKNTNTFFSSAHGIFSRIDHIMGHKSSLGKFKKIEIISSIFSDHNAVRLETNYREKTVKNTNT